MNAPQRHPVLRCVLACCLFALLASANSSFGLSISRPEDDLHEVKIKEFSISAASIEEVVEKLEAEAHEGGIDIKIIFRSDPPSIDMLKDLGSIRNVDLYWMLQFLLARDGLTMAVIRNDKTDPIQVILYKPVKIQSLRMLSASPDWNGSCFYSIFTFEDFEAGNDVPDSVGLTYNRRLDLMQVQARLNLMVAQGGMIEPLTVDPEGYGFLAELETKEGNIYFGFTKNRYGFLNFTVPMDAVNDLPWFTRRVIELLPANYSSALQWLFNNNAFKPDGVELPGTEDDADTKAAPATKP